MKHSLFELFKIGIGPSSSHTMGPMRAALRFITELESIRQTPQTASLQVDLYGSLALTGLGHGTDRAILLGLSGEKPEGVDPSEIESRISAIRSGKTLQLPGHHTIAFEERRHLIFHRDQMYPVAGVASHPNGMRFSAFDRGGGLLLERIFFQLAAALLSLKKSAMRRKPLRVQAIPTSMRCRIPSTAPWNFLKKRPLTTSPSHN